MRFSERIGKKQIKSEIQIDSMDSELRIGIWNVFYLYIIKPLEKENYITESVFKNLVNRVWFSFFKEAMDQIPIYTGDIAIILKERFFSWDYLGVYDFIDFIASHKDPSINYEGFSDSINFILKRELSGYRIVSGSLAPITDELEISEIEKAVSNAGSLNLIGVKTHLSEALKKLSDKKVPDYRNSVKESISAVESICQIITGDPKAELGKALKLISKKLPIHGALEQGFIKIYGYSSDADGIRHALLEESTLDQEDALYMLISCSSFINYLIIKCNKQGIQLSTVS
ncbi:AbiJ-NTD4 domain-containing protein [Algoriphagus sp. NG3]|uniref:AbiJ-NTD4 domain-containing protein n=1 Tax=Algoriphagus sp. NG3 TaxID=3097546 RepID=UPI002A80140C|nr:hypothetical protein [Algoriphagus sp. NG3]WPR76024.1 hypothetical protein SLW71_01510 [Algoriphagus sp. NG3]